MIGGNIDLEDHPSARGGIDLDDHPLAAGGIDIDDHPLAAELLTADAARFVAGLQRRFGAHRDEVLQARSARRRSIASGERLTYRVETEPIRRSSWSVSPPPKDLEDRRVEIAGPPAREALLDAARSGARVITADFEDACSPRWTNILAGHAAIRDFYRGELGHEADGAVHSLADIQATLVVGVRGWHQPEPRMRVDGQPVSATLFDFGLCTFHNARAALDGGSGPYFSLPKTESHLEARLWAEIIGYTERALGLDHASVRVTVLIETILAAFEMDEILYELRDHACGLSAGRCDYLFSLASTFQHDPDYVLPDRRDIRMEVPFMRAFGELLVATCHRRGAHAIGGVSSIVPGHRDQAAASDTARQIIADKWRESGDGFDGSVVAHRDAVAIARAEFDRALGDRPNQLELQRDDVYITAGDLLAVRSTAGSITEQGIRAAVRTGIGYLAARLGGAGTAVIDGVVVDASAAELARAQLWQWIHHQALISNGQALTPDLALVAIDEETAALRADPCGQARAPGGEDAVTSPTGPVDRHDEARRIFRRLTLSDQLAEYLTSATTDLL